MEYWPNINKSDSTFLGKLENLAILKNKSIANSDIILTGNILLPENVINKTKTNNIKNLFSIKCDITLYFETKLPNRNTIKNQS